MTPTKASLIIFCEYCNKGSNPIEIEVPISNVIMWKDYKPPEDWKTMVNFGYDSNEKPLHYFCCDIHRDIWWLKERIRILENDR